MTDERKKEFALKISQANSTGLIVILYEIILVYIFSSVICPLRRLSFLYIN